MAFTRTATRMGALILTNLLLSGAVFAQEAGLAEIGDFMPSKPKGQQRPADVRIDLDTISLGFTLG